MRLVRVETRTGGPAACPAGTAAKPTICIEPVQEQVKVGEKARFKVTANPAPTRTTNVYVWTYDRWSDDADPVHAIQYLQIRNRTTELVYVHEQAFEHAGASVEAVLQWGYRYNRGPGALQRARVTTPARPGGGAGISPTPRISLSAPAEITEGQDLVFTVHSEPAPAGDRTVRLDTHAQGNFGVPGGIVTLTLPYGQTEVTHRMRTIDDGVDEPNGLIYARVSCDGCDPDYSHDKVQVKIRDNDGGPEVHVSVDPRPEAEGGGYAFREGETVNFRLTTDPPGRSVQNVRLRLTARGEPGATYNGNPLPREFSNFSIASQGSSISVATTNDEVGERHGQVTLTLLPGTGYQLPIDTFETVNVYDDDAPPPPLQPRVGPGIEPGSRLTLRWAADPQASGYEVRWGEAEQPVRRTARMNAPEYTTPDLSPGVQYAFEVASCNAAGCGEASPEVVGSVGSEGTPPTANAGPDIEALPGTTVTLQGRDSTNPHGAWHQLAHSWAQREGPEVTLSDPTKGTPSFAVPAGTPVGTAYRFALTVTDRDGETDTDETTVTVVAALGATPPTANAGPDLEGEPGATVTLQGKGSINPHGKWWRMAHLWTQTAGPEVTLSDPTKGLPSFTVPADAAPGTVFGFSLTVTDKDGESDTDAMTVTVPGGAPPVMTVDAPSVAEGGPGERTALVFTLRLDKASTQALSPRVRVTASGSATYRRVDDPAAATGGDGTDVVGRARTDRHATDTVTFAPGETEATLTFTVLGDAGLEADEVLKVEFAPVDGLTLAGGAPALLAWGTIVNDDTAPPPAADAGPDLELAPGETATLGAETEPAEGWSWAWTQTSGPSVTLEGADTPQASFAVPADAADGTGFGFALRVTDAQGGEATDGTAVTVARTASACATGLGSLGAGETGERAAEYWDNPACRAHHRVDRPARYFRFTLTERAAVSIDLATDAEAALFVSKGTPKNGWGAPAKAGMAHRLKVRRDNGKLVHGASLSASLTLAPGSYTAEAVLDADGPDSWRVPSFGLSVAAAAVSPPATASLSVADARVEEGPDAVLSFAVTRDGPSSGTATVSWATSDGTARAGADYTAGSGTLTFAPGDTEKTVEVAVLDDAHDEGEETLTLTLSSPSGAVLGDAEATGTIGNTDPLQRQWLARFGRTVAGQTIEALEGRFAMAPGTPSQVTVAGQRIDFAGALPPPQYDGWRETREETRGMDLRELLLGSSFHLTAGEVSGLGAMTAWGKALTVSSHGSPGGGLSLSSETVTGVIGMDWERDRLLVGVALSESAETGAAGLARSGSDYGIEGTLSLVTPYARLRASDRLSFWTAMGSGEGTMSLAQGGARQSADIAMRMVAAGGRADLLRPGGGGLALALKTDAFFVRTESDSVSTPGVGNLAGAAGAASRVRAVLEGSRPFALSDGGSVEPSLSLGLRRDGGDAETGTGVEVGAGLAWSDPSSGLTSDLRFHGLAAHEDGGYGEWGVSGSLRIVPGPSGGGLSLSMTPSWGGERERGRLWETRPDELAGDGGEPPAGRLDTEIGYGLPLTESLTGTPYAGFGFGQARDYRLGWRLASGRWRSLSLGVEAARREAANPGTGSGAGSKPEHRIGLEAGLRW